MNEQLVTVGESVFDRRTKDLGWAVLATFTVGERGDPVCVEYRVRVVRGENMSERLRNLHQTLDAMERHATDGLAGAGAFPDSGIPRYVFEQASQGRLLEAARAKLQRDDTFREQLSDGARALLAPPAHKPGRPPKRSMADKLRILAAVETADDLGRTLEDVAGDFHMSRSALRDLLSWARRDAQPRLFTARGQGRGGGELTAEARAMLREIEGA